MKKIHDANDIPDHINFHVFERSRQIYEVLTKTIVPNEEMNIYINALINASINLICHISAEEDDPEVIRDMLKEMYNHSIDNVFRELIFAKRIKKLPID